MTQIAYGMSQIAGTMSDMRYVKRELLFLFSSRR